MNTEEFKIALVGDTGVGKTCITVRFVTNTFNIAQQSTSGASFMRKTIQVENRQVKFQIWDTAGQERFRALTPMYYRSAAAVIVVFDITRRASFEHVQDWVKEIKENSEKDVIIVVVGNKIDKSGREVQPEEGQRLAQQLGNQYFEVSAQTGQGVEEIFEYLSRQNLQHTNKQKSCEIIPDSTAGKKCC